MRGHGQQQRTCSGNDRALARDRQAATHHRVEPTRAHHVGQRPPGKGQESLARAGGQN
jgi:hypothetical protein